LGDETVGFVLLYFDEEDDSAEIWQFMIDRKFQRRGLGTLAMSKLLERISQDYPSKTSVILSLFPENDAAVEFYTKCGFQFTGETNGEEAIMEYQGATAA